MRVFTVALIVCVLASAAADVAHIKAAKSKLLSHIAGKGKQHKRGILSHVPPYKLGHDIPLVTHSVIKPVVVNYPPTAAVATVKVPLTNPLVPRYPVPVGHRVPGLPHPHYALRFPHTKYYVKPDQHYHHHHHHVAPKPILPIVPVQPPHPVVHTAPAAPVAHVPQPTAFTLPAPSPPVIIPSPILPPQPVPIAPPPVQVLPQSHLHLKPLLPAATFPLGHAAVLQSPLLRVPQQYVLRPGGAVQSSYFATYPRYPFINSYQAPLYPLANAAPAIQSVHQVVQPHSPHFHLLQQPIPHEAPVEHNHNVLLDHTPTLIHPTHEPQPAIHLHPTQETLPQPTFNIQPTQLIPQPAVHLQPTQPSIPVEHDGWSPVPAQPQDTAHHDLHYPQQGHHFVQEQGTQVYEHHDGQYHDFQHQIQQHIQHQIEQAQYEQSLNNQHQLNHEYGTPQPAQEYGQPNYQGQDYAQQAHDIAQQAQDFAHQAQDFAHHGQDFAHHGQDFAHNGQDFAHHGGDFAHNGQDFAQHGQAYPQQQFGQNEYEVPHQEYGVPQQGVEGRSADDDNGQFHNHIPLALQPPIDRPLDHFH